MPYANIGLPRPAWSTPTGSGSPGSQEKSLSHYVPLKNLWLGIELGTPCMQSMCCTLELQPFPKGWPAFAGLPLCFRYLQWPVQTLSWPSLWGPAILTQTNWGKTQKGHFICVCSRDICYPCHLFRHLHTNGPELKALASLC